MNAFVETGAVDDDAAPASESEPVDPAPAEPTPAEPAVADPAGLPPGRAVELNGRGTTWAYDTGPRDAPAVMLLHGWTATAALNWLPSFDDLAEHHRVIALDHRGHGRGIRAPQRFSLEDCADDAVALADALGVDRFVAVGYSMGGPVAQLAWRRHPKRVRGLVLCATSRHFRGRPAERALFAALRGMSVAARVTPSAWRNAVRDRVFAGRFDDTDLGRWACQEMGRNDPRMVAEAGRAIGVFDSRSWIGGVDVPTAVVVTERDPVVPIERQLGLAGAITGASLFAVDGDHSVCATVPERFVPALLDACDDVTGRAGRRDRQAS